MIRNLITQDTLPEEWDEIRKRIKSRIEKSFGTSPVPLAPQKNDFCELERYEAHGFLHIKIKYHVFDNEWAYGLLILPKGLKEGEKAHAVLTIHGTNGEKGKYGVCNPEKPERNYALELAERGFITFSPDQFGFGEAMSDEEYARAFDRYYDKYPEWSLSSRRVLGHIRALDVLDQLDYVEHDGYGAMGNSLGGQAVFYLPAFDKRVKVSVPSTGISPNVTNIYRALKRTQQLEPAVVDIMIKDGRAPWELNEMLALCAPCAMLCIEPFVDPHNPHTSLTIDCIRTAAEVYTLLGVPERISMYIHGDGHNTVKTVRSLAYDWIERFLV